MKILEFALETEKMAKDFFQGLAQGSTTEGPRNIFSLLAAEQQEIAEALQGMKDEFLLLDADSGALDKASAAIHAIFREHRPGRPPANDMEAYQLAVDVERAVVKVFRELMDRESNQGRKRLLGKVVEEEAKHCAELEKVYDFVAEPAMTLVDAENAGGME